MDTDLQVVWDFAIGTAMGAATAVGVLVVAPAAAAGLVWLGASAQTASGVVSLGLFGLEVYGGLNLVFSSIDVYQEGDWNELAFNASLFFGGLVVGAKGARAKLANGMPGANRQRHRRCGMSSAPHATNGRTCTTRGLRGVFRYRG